jgi:hypothetical protein
VRCAHGHTFRYATGAASPPLALALQQSGAAAKRRHSGKARSALSAKRTRGRGLGEPGGSPSINKRWNPRFSGFRSCAQSGVATWT